MLLHTCKIRSCCCVFSSSFLCCDRTLCQDIFRWLLSQYYMKAYQTKAHADIVQISASDISMLDHSVPVYLRDEEKEREWLERSNQK